MAAMSRNCRRAVTGLASPLVLLRTSAAEGSAVEDRVVLDTTADTAADTDVVVALIKSGIAACGHY